MVRNLWMYAALGWMPKSGKGKIVVLPTNVHLTRSALCWHPVRRSE